MQMDANMSVDDVLNQIKDLKSNGEALNKKKVKQAHPELMQNALYYFPSWDHALQNTEEE